MNFFTYYIHQIYNTDGLTAFLVFLVMNVLIFFISMLLGRIILKIYKHKRITQIPKSITAKEIILTVSTVFFNAFVTLIAWFLWKNGIVHFTFETNYWLIVDFLILFFGMDFLMYVFHRIAHIPFIYRILHFNHHEFKDLRPLTLYVLNPLESMGFGAMWTVLLCMYTSSWYAVALYLGVNVIFGLFGHLGVEPVPASWQKYFPFRLITTSYFHAVHHNDISTNFGFYTTIWDRLAKTIAPYYYSKFGQFIQLKPKEKSDS